MLNPRKIFIGYRDQDNYEQFLSVLRSLKRWKQKAAYDVQNRTDLSPDKANRVVIEVTKILPKLKKNEGALINVLESWFLAEKYRKKYYDYKRLVKELQLQKNCTYLFGSFGTIDIENLDRKIALAERLFAFADQLSHDYSLINEQQFDLLEIELAPLLTSKDYLVLNASGVRKEADTLLQFLSRKVTYFLVRIVRKLRRSHKRDVRKELREMVRFHFKNMDDESDATEIFDYRSKNFISSKSFIHGYSTSN